MPKILPPIYTIPFLPKNLNFLTFFAVPGSIIMGQNKDSAITWEEENFYEEVKKTVVYL